MEHLLAALMPQNRLALEVSMATGLRIGDVLSLRSCDLARAADKGRITVRESKTGKSKRIYIPVYLVERMLMVSGKYFVFEHRTDRKKHRTRQAVFKDLKRVAIAFRLKANIAPHSCRKIYAVEQFHRCGDLKKVQKLLNHENEAVTMLYAMADELTKRTLSGRSSHKSR